jgi:hypothetical protein
MKTQNFITKFEGNSQFRRFGPRWDNLKKQDMWLGTGTGGCVLRTP